MNKKDCKYKHCINVEVDWLNILLSVSASHTITELFKASECTVDPNSLRSGGKFRKFADWEHVKQTCDSIGAQQLLELKRVTSDFQKDRMREHKSIESKLNKRTEAPVNFAFTEDYDHISVAKCRFCKAWLFRLKQHKRMVLWSRQIYRRYQHRRRSTSSTANSSMRSEPQPP